MPHVIATAGHVDHGKSALIVALTGIDPDRLAEEKARGMTIDLGFAWAALPSGREVGFVDVPGHERFVHNMLAGVGGVDCALLVVDAVEGWRPQSEEHLAILDLLGIRAGVVAVTKCDLVAEPERLAAVTGAVAARLATSTLAGAEIVATSATTGSGLDELRAALDRALDEAGEPPDRGRPRVPVDRVFSVRGAGTVVTGTLAGGELTAEVEAELLPSGRRVRVRGLEGHGRALDGARPAQRVAANLAGVAVEDVARGEVLVLPGLWRATTTADARLHCLASAPAPLRSRGAWLLYAGAAETAVRLQLVDAAEIPPGGSGLVRLHLERPLVLDPFEPVVVRDAGRDETVGGGPVLDPFPGGGSGAGGNPADPPKVHGTAARVQLVERLEARAAAGRAGLVERVLAELGVVALGDLPWLAGAGPARALAALDRLAAADRAVRTLSTAWSPSAWASARQAVLDTLAAHQRTEPLAAGLQLQAARAAAISQGAPPAAGIEVVDALVDDGEVVADGPLVRLPGQQVRLDPRQAAARFAIEEALDEVGISALTEKELAELGADRDLVAVLERMGVLVQVSQGIWLGSRTLADAVDRLREAYAGGRPFTAGEARETLGTTRRTAIPLLEHLDRSGLTRRHGDQRQLSGDRAGG